MTFHFFNRPNCHDKKCTREKKVIKKKHFTHSLAMTAKKKQRVENNDETKTQTEK